MQSTDAPSKVVLPFAAGGGRSIIPVGSQIGITDGAASLTDGFPPLTRTPPGAGGKPPSGLEMNGILYLISAGVWWQQAGGLARYDAVYSAAIGGYPAGALLQSADGAGVWRSTAENNTSNPDAGGANWVPHAAYGESSQALASANVTLTAAQALRPHIALTGVISANINLIFPAWLSDWLVINATTGAFTITAKTAAGTGVVLEPGPNQLYGDGANIKSALSAYVPRSALTGANQSLTNPGFKNDPGGQIEKWGSFYAGNAPTGPNTTAITFPLAFPTAALFVHLTVQDQSGANNLIVSWKDLTASGFTLAYQETASASQDATIHWIARGY